MLFRSRPFWSKLGSDSEIQAERTKNNKMSEKMNAITILRRPARLFFEEQQLLEVGNTVGHESRYSSGDERENDRQRDTVPSLTSIKVLRVPVVLAVVGSMALVVPVALVVGSVVPMPMVAMGMLAVVAVRPVGVLAAVTMAVAVAALGGRTD